MSLLLPFLSVSWLVCIYSPHFYTVVSAADIVKHKIQQWWFLKCFCATVIEIVRRKSWIFDWNIVLGLNSENHGCISVHCTNFLESLWLQSRMDQKKRQGKTLFQCLQITCYFKTHLYRPKATPPWKSLTHALRTQNWR